jgi:isochorismate synthase
VCLAGERVSTAALAGSAPRGRSPEEDARIARALRESKKEQEEHAYVVREIAASLRPLCDELALPEAPRLLALDGIQHLETPVEARLRPALDPRPVLFDLVERLHPTPAVCGTPRAAATAWLRRNEDLERGWYAGGVGFVDAEGGGEVGVALRSGVLDGSSARLFAGAGLVAASRPEAELAETRLKLRTLLSQLTEI